MTLSPLALASITFSGAVNPDPSSGTVDFLDVGTAALGTFAVDAGSTFTANSLNIGSGQTGNGTVTITGTTSGPQTIINLLGPPDLNTIRSPLVVGAWGTGTMTVSQGAIINGLGSSTCVQNLCNTFVGNTGGSSGTLTLTGAGTTASLGGSFNVGFSVAFTQAANGFNFGTPGGTSTGVLNVQNGAALNTYSASLGSIGTSAGNLGTEQAIAHVTVDGTNSIWTISHNPVTGATGGLGMANGQNTSATLDVTHSGQVILTDPNAFLGVGNGGIAALTISSGGAVTAANLGIGNQSTGSGTVTVGGGVGQSVLSVSSSMGVGNQSSANSQLTINAGGTVNVTGANGLGIAGSAGSHGTVLVDGGALNVNGPNAFFGVGNSGTGTLTVINGGSVSAVNLGLGGSASSLGTMTVGNGNGQSVVTVSNSMGVGNGSTATSTLTINAGGAVNVTGGSGLGIAGSVGSNGSVLVDGGQLTVSGTSSGIGIGNQGTGSLTIKNAGNVMMAGQNNGVGVGNQGTGTLNINTGGTLTTESLTVAGSAGSSGVVNIVGTTSGPQTIVTLNGPASSSNGVNPLQVGNWGNGTMTVSNGAIVNVAVGNANCGVATAFCNNFVGNAAGSTGSLTLKDTGTTMTLAGGFTVGNAAVFTNPPSNFTFGTPGGTTNATLKVLNGATLNTNGATVSTGPTGPNPDGTEHTIATVTIDGTGSAWNIARNPVTGGQATLNVANSANATATIDITNAGKLVITGTNPTPNSVLPGLFLNGAGATMNVNGAGSAIVINGDTGQIVVGTNGGTPLVNATLNVTGGGKIYSDDPNGLMFMNVGVSGATGTLNIDGAGSKLTLSGVGGASTGPNNANGGGFLTIGRQDGSTGTASVTNGGSILISDGGQNATAFGAGINIGRESGSSGSLTVSGLGSNITIEQTGTLTTASAGINIGRTGHGELTVIGGATILINDSSQSPTGGGSGFAIGRDTGSSGSVTVDGIGSSITISQTRAGTIDPAAVVGRSGMGDLTVTNGATVTVNGPFERDFNVGGAVGGTGTLTVSNGAVIGTSFFGVGNNGGTGHATFDNASLAIDGVVFNPLNSTYFGGSVRVGRGAGSAGILDLVNGAQITLDSTTAGSAINLGGTGTALGGNGTLNMSGGSSISFVGSGTSVNIGHSGTGLFTMTGASTLTLPSDGSIVLGNTASGNGTLQLGGGSSIDTGFLAVGNNGHGSVQMTGGTLGVHGTDPNTDAFVIGANSGSVGMFSQSGGVVTVDSSLDLAQQSGSSGTYMLSGGTLNTRQLTVGDRGTGVFVNSGSAVSAINNVNGLLIVGGDASSNGSYTNTGSNAQTHVNFAPGGLGPTNPPGLNGVDPVTMMNRPTPNGALGVGIGGTGTFTQGAANSSDPGNAVTVAGDLAVGVFVGGQGTYTLNTGTLTVGGKVVIGGQSQGANVFTQNGGFVTVTGAASSNPDYVGLGGNNFSGSLIVGGGINDLGGGTGTYVMNGGNLTANAAAIGNNGGSGTFTQTGGSASFGSLSLATTSVSGPASNGTYAMSGGGSSLTVSGNVIIGDAGVGTFTQNGGTHTIGGALILGNQASGNGTYGASNGASIVLTGAGATAVIGQGGTGVMTMIEGSTLILPSDGKVIVGASAGASGTLELQGGSSIQAGAVFGIAHDGTNSTGATANVYLDQGSSITATNIYLGDGCLGGNGGVLHGNFVMNGQAAVVNCAPPVLSIVHPNTITPFGILHPGRSPGVLTIDGGFQFIAGTIMLEVQSDGMGGFLTDEIIFTFGTALDVKLANIEFFFLDGTNPNDFIPFWNLDAFLKTVTADGTVEGISALGDLDTLFADATYTADSDAYVITDFTFSPTEGVTSIDAVPVATTVPEPGSMMLVLLAGALLVFVVRRRAAASIARRT